MAIASTGLFLSANIGCLAGASLASKVLQASLRNGLSVGLQGNLDQKLVSLFDLSIVEFLILFAL